MLLYIPPDRIDIEHLGGLALSVAAGPRAATEEAGAILDRLLKGQAQAFEFDCGMLVLENHRPRLRIVAWAGYGSIFLRRELADELRTIAAEWGCDIIETTVFDRRLADAIVTIGGECESYTVILKVEG